MNSPSRHTLCSQYKDDAVDGLTRDHTTLLCVSQIVLYITLHFLTKISLVGDRLVQLDHTNASV